MSDINTNIDKPHDQPSDTASAVAGLVVLALAGVGIYKLFFDKPKPKSLAEEQEQEILRLLSSMEEE